MATDQETIGSKIAELREKRGLSGNALAKQAGISQPYLWSIEQGDCSPTIDTIRKICQVLNVSMHRVIPK